MRRLCLSCGSPRLPIHARCLACGEALTSRIGVEAYWEGLPEAFRREAEARFESDFVATRTRERERRRQAIECAAKSAAFLLVVGLVSGVGAAASLLGAAAAGGAAAWMCRRRGGMLVGLVLFGAAYLSAALIGVDSPGPLELMRFVGGVMASAAGGCVVGWKLER